LSHISAVIQVPRNDDGLEALIFTADGDMRQAINNLQSAFYGFKYINSENVFKVCDQPHPVVIHNIIENCSTGNVKEALTSVKELWDQGYSALDIVTTLFRVVKNYSSLDEGTKLEYIKVS
jgi:replication factor C subunit 2/4